MKLAKITNYNLIFSSFNSLNIYHNSSLLSGFSQTKMAKNLTLLKNRLKNLFSKYAKPKFFLMFQFYVSLQ